MFASILKVPILLWKVFNFTRHSSLCLLYATTSSGCQRVNHNFHEIETWFAFERLGVQFQLDSAAVVRSRHWCQQWHCSVRDSARKKRRTVSHFGFPLRNGVPYKWSFVRLEWMLVEVQSILSQVCNMHQAIQFSTASAIASLIFDRRQSLELWRTSLVCANHLIPNIALLIHRCGVQIVCSCWFRSAQVLRRTSVQENP